MSDTVQLEIKRNDTWLIDFYWVDLADVPIPLPGATAEMQLRKGSNVPVLDVSTTSGEIVIDEAGGIVKVEIPDTSMGIDPAIYDCDLELTYNTGRVQSTDTFRVKVLQDVTRED